MQLTGPEISKSDNYSGVPADWLSMIEALASVHTIAELREFLIRLSGPLTLTLSLFNIGLNRWEELIRLNDADPAFKAEGLHSKNNSVSWLIALSSDQYKYAELIVKRTEQISDIHESELKELLNRLQNSLSACIVRILYIQSLHQKHEEEIQQYRQHLEAEKLSLQGEVMNSLGNDEIVGDSLEIRKIFQQISQVAATESTILILGETGTGKELVARAIHNHSPRKNNLLVKINCATLPVHLMESELFGHEKGSFTGATDRRIGKFELAHNGTLFLDEIGELPLDLQAKLLRVIQEREIERIGGKSVVKVNVRLIAATNRDLFREVEEGKFRLDLFYRLNVFPILLPPLRNRKEDIPALALYFTQKYSRKTGKEVKNLSGKAIKRLLSYHWPGNVRELEHLMERSVLETAGRTIDDVPIPVTRKKEQPGAPEALYVKTLEENERDHIVKALHHCNGKIYGPGGAAELLNLKVSTLNSRIKKLGIRKNNAYS